MEKTRKELEEQIEELQKNCHSAWKYIEELADIAGRMRYIERDDVDFGNPVCNTCKANFCVGYYHVANCKILKKFVSLTEEERAKVKAKIEEAIEHEKKFETENRLLRDLNMR